MCFCLLCWPLLARLGLEKYSFYGKSCENVYIVYKGFYMI